jgi:hypothetical protein
MNADRMRIFYGYARYRENKVIEIKIKTNNDLKPKGPSN